MAAQRCEISLRALKSIYNQKRSERVNNFSTREEKFRIFKRPCNCYIYYINTNKLPNHLTFASKDAIYHVTIAKVIFSPVKTNDIFTSEDVCFRAKVHLMFH